MWGDTVSLNGLSMNLYRWNGAVILAALSLPGPARPLRVENLQIGGSGPEMSLGKKEKRYCVVFSNVLAFEISSTSAGSGLADEPVASQ